MAPPARDDGHDTSLARELHARSAAPVELLQASLAEARRRRAQGGSSEEACLEAVISERALVAPPVLAEATRTVLTASGDRERSARSGDRERSSRSGEGQRSTSGTFAAVPLSSDEHRAPREPVLPPQLGPFRMRRELARGGMGAVWEVEHIETGRVYALKTILAAGRLEGPGGEAMARFRREAELGARLDHPHVVHVHSADLEGTTPWLVQTYLPGGSLEERLKRGGPLPVQEAAEVVAKVARGLAHAHARGVLHRDLKPANVLFDGEGQPRVVDFGVARSLREGTMRLTATGEVLGSPAYMAPEQALGEKQVDARADVHALGVLLYALLTGRPPFDGKLTLEVIEMVISKVPAPPSASRPEVPAALDAVVLRCLEKDPAARFQTADAVADALEACLAPVEAPPRARAPIAVAVLAVVAIAAVVVAGLALARGRRPAPSPPPPDTAAPPPTTATPPPPTTTAPPPPATTSPVVRVPTSWLATFQADETFGFSWEDDMYNPTPGGLSLTFQRLAVVESESELRVRLKVRRLAYWTAMNMSHDSANGPLTYGALAGATRKALAYVNAVAEAEVELRLARRTGAVLALEGLPDAPVLTDDELKEVEAPLCLRLMGYLSANTLSAQLDNVLRVLPVEAQAEDHWEAPRRLFGGQSATLNVRLDTHPAGPPGRFELSPPPGTLFQWQGDRVTEPRKNSRATGWLQVEEGRIVESAMALEVHCPTNSTRSPEPRTLHWKFRWTRGEPAPPPAPQPFEGPR